MSGIILGQDTVPVPTIEELAQGVAYLIEANQMMIEAMREMHDRITKLEGGDGA